MFVVIKFLIQQSYNTNFRKSCLAKIQHALLSVLMINIMLSPTLDFRMLQNEIFHHVFSMFFVLYPPTCENSGEHGNSSDNCVDIGVLLLHHDCWYDCVHDSTHHQRQVEEVQVEGEVHPGSLSEHSAHRSITTLSNTERRR